MVFLVGAGAEAYLRSEGCRCEVLTIARPEGSADVVRVWEAGVLVRRSALPGPPSGGSGGVRYVVRVETTVAGADGARLAAEALRDADGSGVRIRLGSAELVARARAAGVDPAAVEAAPGAGTAGREAEGGWRALRLEEVVEAAEAAQGGKRAKLEGSNSREGAAAEGLGHGGSDDSLSDGDAEEEEVLGAWQTIAVREVTAAQAADEAAATMHEGHESLVQQVLGTGASTEEAGDPAPEVYRGVLLATPEEEVADADPVVDEAAAARALQASAAVGAAAFKRRKVRAAASRRDRSRT